MLVPAGLALAELRRRRAWPARAQVLALAAGPGALAVWFGYLRVRFGDWPLTRQPGTLALPGDGWADSLRLAAEALYRGGAETQLGSVAIPLLIAMAGALAVGAVRAAALRTPLDAVYLVFVPLAAALGWLTLLYPKELLRNLAIPLLLLPAVLATPQLAAAQRRNAR